MSKTRQVDGMQFVRRKIYAEYTTRQPAANKIVDNRRLSLNDSTKIAPNDHRSAINKRPKSRDILQKSPVSSIPKNTQLANSSKSVHSGTFIATHAVRNSIFKNVPQENSFSQSFFSTIHPKTTKAKKFFYSVGITSFAIALLVGLQTFIVNSQASDQVTALNNSSINADEQGVPQGTGSEPAESKPNGSAFSAYQVAAESPRYIRIPSLGVESRIKQLGTTKEGAVDAPWNIHDTGWYDGTIKPGSKSGVSLLLGHVSGISGPGVFNNIKNLVEKDLIEVERGDGTILSYAVDTLVEVPVDSIDMAEVLYGIEPGEHSLRLMTCAGIYDKDTKQFSSRTIVYASPVK